MAGSHLDQAYLGEAAPNSLIATATAGAQTPGGVDVSSLVPAPLPAKSNAIAIGLAGGLVAYIICRALSGSTKSRS